MPRKPKHPCGYPGCKELTDRRYCEKHEKLVNKQYERYGRDPSTKNVTAEHGNGFVTAMLLSIPSVSGATRKES